MSHISLSYIFFAFFLILNGVSCLGLVSRNLESFYVLYRFLFLEESMINKDSDVILYHFRYGTQL